MGAKTADVVAADRWKKVLAEYPDPGIDAGIDEQLREFIAKRRLEIGND
jgi:trimethylamine:corrinoid methyltransferase-like protein